MELAGVLGSVCTSSVRIRARTERVVSRRVSEPAALHSLLCACGTRSRMFAGAHDVWKSPGVPHHPSGFGAECGSTSVYYRPRTEVGPRTQPRHRIYSSQDLRSTPGSEYVPRFVAPQGPL
jgi:hypothetical protein